MDVSIAQESLNMRKAHDFAHAYARGYVHAYVRAYACGFAEGRLEEARDFIVLIGTERFGPPDATARRKLQSIADLEHLHRIGLQIGKVRTWKDLFTAE